MFDLASHLDQMLKIIFELTNDEHQTESMTTTQLEWLETTRNSIIVLQNHVPIVLHADPSNELRKQLRHEWFSHITCVMGYSTMLPTGVAGDLSGIQQSNLNQLKTLVEALVNWSALSYDFNLDEE